MLTVLVDARNVLRSQWPNMPERELVERCRIWAHRKELRTVLVFDGRAPGGLVGERDEDELLGLVGTGAESADDWLTRAAAQAAEDGSPYWLVTSDRELRRRAGGAERMIGGGSFLRTLTDAG